MVAQVIPSYTFGGAATNATGLVPRGTLEATAAAIESMRLTVAARRAPLPVIYGLDRVGGLITRPVVDASGNLLVPVILSIGEIDSVVSVEFDDQPAPAGVTRTDYLGTASQTADPWLVAAWAARGVTYADTLPGVAYTVLKVPPGNQYGFASLQFVVRGRRVHEPRRNVDLWATLKTSILPEIGPAPLSFARNLPARVRDWEGRTRLVPANCSRHRGARVVENLLRRITGLSSANLSGTGFVINGATISGPDADGWYTITRTGTGSNWAHWVAQSAISGYPMADKSFSVRIDVAAVSAPTVQFNLAVSDLANFTDSVSRTATATATTFGYTTTVAFVNNGYFGPIGIYLYNNGDAIKIRRPQCEDVTGQSIRSPAEYISVGALSFPYHGAGVDGVKYFDCANQNAMNVSTGLVTEGAVPTNKRVAWLRHPGRSGNGVSTPNAAANRITGDITARVQLALPSYSQASTLMLLSKANSAGAQFGYDLYINNANQLVFRVSTDGSTGAALKTGSATTALSGVVAAGQRVFVQARRVASSGVITFEYSFDESNWLALGTASPGTGNIYASSEPVAIGIQSNGTSNPTQGVFFGAKIFNNATGAGTPVVEFSAADFVAAASTAFSATTGETWTVNTSGAGNVARIEEAFTDATLDRLYGEPSATYGQANATLSAWTAIGTPSATQNALARDGSITAWTMTDNDPAAHEGVSEARTIPNDSASRLVTISVNKDSTTTRYVGVGAALSGGTGLSRLVHLNTATGETVTESGAADGAHYVVEHVSHWEVCIWITNNTTGNTTLTHTLYPARGTVLGTANVAAQGSAAFSWPGRVANLSNSDPVEWIDASAGDVARPADVLTFDKAALISNTAGAVFASAKAITWRQASVIGDSGGGASVPLSSYGSNSGVQIHDGTTAGLGPVGTPAANARLSLATHWGNGTMRAYANGAGGTEVAYDGTMTLTNLSLFKGAAGYDFHGCIGDVGVVKSFKLLPAQMTAGVDGSRLVLDYAADPNSTWSQNPALCYADLITNALYGRGESIDAESVAVTADTNDGFVGTEPRRTLGLTIGDRRPIDDWDAVLRALAGCWKVYEGNTAKLIADAPASAVYAYTRSNTLLDSIRLTRRDPASAPTVFRVQHTDRSLTPWGQSTQEYVLPGVDTGELPYIDSNISMPGIYSAGMALREAIRRGKASELTDTNIRLVATDESISIQIGDVFSVTESAYGLAAKLFRCTDIKPIDIGRYEVFGIEYQAAVYSDDTADDEVTPDTGLPNPNNPPAVTDLVVTEVLVQKQGAGVWVSSILAQWVNPAYGFRDVCVVEVTQGGEIKATGATTGASQARWQSAELREALAYLVNVYTRSGTGALSMVTQAAITLQGKGTVPGNPLTFTARELGGKLFCSVTIPNDPSIDGIEIRELPDGSSNWDDAGGTVVYAGLDLMPVIEGRPAGDFAYAVKTRDTKRTAALPTGQYSASMLTQDVTITLDTNSIIRDTYVFASPTVTNMTEYHNVGDAARYWVTDVADGIGYGADNTDNAVGTFADSLQHVALAHPHTSATSEWLSETFDFGQALQADWRVEAPVTDISGAASVILQLKKLIGDAWTDITTMPARGEYRYARLKIEALTTETISVQATATSPRLSIDAAAKRETGSVTTSATVATTVTLEGYYSLAKAVLVTPKGTSAKSGLYDNIVLSQVSANTFDVYAFDDAGSQVAVEVSWTFEGI